MAAGANDLLQRNSNIMETHFLATYYLETQGDLHRVAAEMVTLETTGQWMGLEGEPTPLFTACRGEVVEVREQAPGRGEVVLAFPLVNLNLEEAAFPGLWLTMVGGGTHALKLYEKSRLVDFRLPDSALRYFPGPRFGPEGTRRLLGLGPNDLIVGTIVKPTAGLTPEQVAAICYEAALGGMRFIKDDEKMLNTAYCPLAARVRRVTEALRRAEDQTGQKVLYAPHITAGPDRILDNAYIALENGANALMMNFLAAGFGSLEMLARARDIQVPIYAHCGGKEAFTRVPGQGVDERAIVRFVRLLGGDYFRVSTVGGYLIGGDAETIQRQVAVMREPMGPIKPMMPAVSGGLKPGNLGENLALVGFDAMMLAGSGVNKHPKGIRAGTLAMLQAAEAYRQGIAPDEYARNHAELRLAL
jgi:ribulose 1,5-bisphosphate carboxylase large subunit-like protein